MSSQEVLEANVAAIRVDLNELKSEFRAAVTRIDSDIKAAVSKLESEIRAMGTKASDDIKQLAQDMREMRAEDKALREKMDKGDDTINRRHAQPSGKDGVVAPANRARSI